MLNKTLKKIKKGIVLNFKKTEIFIDDQKKKKHLGMCRLKFGNMKIKNSLNFIEKS